MFLLFQYLKNDNDSLSDGEKDDNYLEETQQNGNHSQFSKIYSQTLVFDIYTKITKLLKTRYRKSGFSQISSRTNTESSECWSY